MCGGSSLFFVTTCNLEKNYYFGNNIFVFINWRKPQNPFFYEKVFAALAALAMMVAVVSCEYDLPDIRFQQTTTITNDYSEVVKALLDQTLALSKKWNSWRTP